MRHYWTQSSSLVEDKAPKQQQQQSKSMKNERISCMGLFYTLQEVPETAEEYGKTAGADGLLKDAINYTVMHRMNSLFRDAFIGRLSDQLAKKYPDRLAELRPLTKEVEGEVVQAESQLGWFKRVCALTGTEPSDYQDVADGLSQTFSAAPRRRGAGGEKPVADKWIMIAKGVIDKFGADRVATKLSAVVGYTVEPTIESIARARRDFESLMLERARRAAASEAAIE